MDLLPAASGADVIRVLRVLGFVPVDQGGRLVKLQKHFQSVLVPNDPRPLDPDDLRTILRAADVAREIFVEFLNELQATG